MVTTKPYKSPIYGHALAGPGPKPPWSTRLWLGGLGRTLPSGCRCGWGWPLHGLWSHGSALSSEPYEWTYVPASTVAELRPQADLHAEEHERISAPAASGSSGLTRPCETLVRGRLVLEPQAHKLLIRWMG